MMEAARSKHQMKTEKTDWQALIKVLGKDFAERAGHYDQTGTFVKENYAQLKAHRFFSAMIRSNLAVVG